jgi:hypothetical protein
MANIEYTIKRNVRAETDLGKKNWWIISGVYQDRNGDTGSYALTFTSKEFAAIKKIISKKIAYVN